ncbi:hypothetical protein A2410_03585 [Candidatus Shapirobacteria bacterium RIFOXYC1_FULL_38_24]|uniref:DUF3048 domain-containing protein n=2 Tax=Candidatus Shapironibacteriota TaxID=1752721 RepID=A0A0G0N311_9BACT|nr:MAG: hypothetical protein US90_C0002G0009 [Candidatus Shapirobacteria bacterium GW2011_GWE2_38_30]OGL55203.1 MAG: hypothetical protein A2195_02410 [Candidatus Shapirobacteria bacterium RIFOXYA1_FULL_39_17]OGL56029.1 MAG: hypothetical protein A2410_03585 [Candidatus Shapirobacteria bacterium RIFOXYC1_FULL_38_24]OGL57500.1 MAG: hypothetical protein A2367_02180 [Candidatus Shapirobacteria bacterium RIFOXYB1_FULL_38_38]HAP37816.1 hypothetical protein [Candidatus Shapirobacteria bacterium]
MDKKVIVPVYTGLFLLLSGIFYLTFDKLIPVNQSIATPTSQTDSDQEVTDQDGVLQFEGPKTEACPLNGVLYTKEQQTIWSARRPLLVMIENHLDSRPQSGLSNADVIYETVAEGGITRFMAVYYCAVTRGSTYKYDVGPVRSARTYYLDLASEYSDYPLYTHVGGANCSAATPGGPCTTAKKAQAIEQISQYGWNNKGTWSDLSQFSLSYKVCRREPERTGEVKATEHTMYCSTEALWETAADRGLTNLTEINKTSWDKNFKTWQFTQKDNPTVSDKSISFGFWGDASYAVKWVYDQTSNNYVRHNGGEIHIDIDTKKPLTTKNVIIQFVKETRSVDEHVHNLYGIIGTGKGVLIQNGTHQDITWSKNTRTSRTIFKDKSGKEVNFVPGTIWIEILPIGNKIEYEI